MESDPFGPDPYTALTEPAPLKEEKEEKERMSFLAELPILMLVALVMAIIIKTFLVQAFFIPSGSMLPTLEIDDRVMVNKLSVRFGEPEQGDVVVFDSPLAPNGDDDPALDRLLRTIQESLGIRTAVVPDDFIKRVIGTPGDTVEIRGNQVYVNGEAIEEPYVAAGSNMADSPARTLREDEYFVMGDNRNNSYDSRRFGPITEELLIGKAFVIVWPADRFTRL
jgi:signal peptidase I